MNHRIIYVCIPWRRKNNQSTKCVQFNCLMPERQFKRERFCDENKVFLIHSYSQPGKHSTENVRYSIISVPYFIWEVLSLLLPENIGLGLLYLFHKSASVSAAYFHHLNSDFFFK